jgi:hypothetical protein
VTNATLETVHETIMLNTKSFFTSDTTLEIMTLFAMHFVESGCSTEFDETCTSWFVTTDETTLEALTNRLLDAIDTNLTTASTTISLDLTDRIEYTVLFTNVMHIPHSPCKFCVSCSQ